MAALRQVIPGEIPFPQNDDDDNAFEKLLSQLPGNQDDFKDVLENEKQNLKVDESIKNDITVTPSEIQQLAHDVINSDELAKSFDEEDVDTLVDLKSDQNTVDEFLQTLDVNCEDCVTYEKVNHISKVKPGDHIRFHRHWRQFNLYNHHAIVTDVKWKNSEATKGELTLVHFQKDMRRRITVIKETKTFDVISDNIDIVQYRSGMFTPDQIVARANKMTAIYEENNQNEAYSLSGNNCENKSNEIATGVKYSTQISSKAKYVKSTMCWLCKSLLKIGIKFCGKLKPVIRGFAHIAVLASLLSIVDQIASLKSKVKQGLLCLKCYDKEYKKLLCSLIFCLISVGISVTFQVSGLYFGISTPIAVALPCIASGVLDRIMSIVQPASEIPKPIVNKMDMIKKGDVITFPYSSLNHEGVVVETKHRQDHQDGTVKVTVVHFNYPGLFGTRTVVKDVFYFNLRNQFIYVYDFSKETTFPPMEVVKRANEKLGSQNFSTFNNRSSHIARYCKVGDPKLKDLPYKRVTKMSEISPGDIINFSYFLLPHDAVVMKVENPETIDCKVIHYNYEGILGTRKIVEESFVFKLSDQNVYVHDYKGYDVYELDEVVRRARSRIGEQKFNTFNNRSSHLARWCKIKN